MFRYTNPAHVATPRRPQPLAPWDCAEWCWQKWGATGYFPEYQKCVDACREKWWSDRPPPSAPSRRPASTFAQQYDTFLRQNNPIEGMPGGSVTGCIAQNQDKDDPGAYCAAIADRIEPGWRDRNPGGV